VGVNLSDNAIGSFATPGIQTLLEGHVNLKRLELNNNGLDQESGAMIAQYIGNAQGTRLEVLSAYRNRLQKVGFQKLGNACRDMGSLRQISVQSNTVGAEGTIAFLESLGHNPNLQVLELHDNVINTPESIEALRLGIGSLKYLNVLNLGDCLLGVTGALAMFTALQGTNEHLRELQVNDNDIESSSELVAAIEEALRGKADLEFVNF
jgi:Ran GTPase-activating protein 1